MKIIKKSNMQNLRVALATALILSVSLNTEAQHKTKKADGTKVRISWDSNTYQEFVTSTLSNSTAVVDNLHYPRIKRLSDGSLLFSYNDHHYGWSIFTQRSTDNGKTWSPALRLRENHTAQSTVGDDEKVFVNPDFIELKDGRILLAYQWRYKNGYHDLPNTNENCGVEIMISEDKGKTFSQPREVYRGRCWEPAMLQLPSGEIHMYITSSQDVVNQVSYPRTIVIRSFDGAKTWQGKTMTSYKEAETISRTVDERFAYDGMPTAVWLDDNKGIAMPVEVWSGKLIVDQTPVIIKTDAKSNWRGDQQKIITQGGPDYPLKKQINKDLHGFGPYSTKLATGEVIVLSNGQYKGEQGIWTLIGDKDADNFHHATSPFNGHWGSIDYIGNHQVLATGTANYVDSVNVDRAKVVMMKARLNYAKELKSGELHMPSLNSFDREQNAYWFLGKKTTSSTYTNFGYTEKSFLLGTYYFDENLAAFTPENSDASVLLLSRKAKDGDWINFKIVVNPVGKYLVYTEDNYSWKLLSSGTTNDVEVGGTINNEVDKDLGYRALLRLDWATLGGRPIKGEQFRAHPRLHYKKKSTEKPAWSTEDLAGENSDYPNEWLTLTFLD